MIDSLINFLRSIDQHGFLAVYGFVSQYEWLKLVAFYIARYGILIYLFVLIYLFFWPRERKSKIRGKKAVVYVFLCLALAFLADELINLLKVRYRPFVTFPTQVARLNVLEDLTSFPSTHTIFVFAISVSLWLSRYKWLSLPLLFLAVLLGLSRIAAGVHYPFDILGGAFLGIFIPVFIHQEGSWFKRQLLDHKDLL